MERPEEPSPFLYQPKNAKISPPASPTEAAQILEPPMAVPTSLSVPDSPDVPRSRSAPSDNETRRRAAVQLMNLGFSPRLLMALLEKFDFDPEAALSVSASEFEVLPGATSRQFIRFRDPAHQLSPHLFGTIERSDVQILSVRDRNYPASLKQIYDPPALLMQWGNSLPADVPCIGMVGSRRATPYGIAVAERFSRELAEKGCAVISGGAAGIDTASHRGALAGSGGTYAFLGCGIDVDYPRENRDLFAKIRERGALFSEYAPGTQPDPWRFPARNRLISGTSQAIVVVEAPLKSGALLTARDAAEQGRSVLAVPGNIDRISSAGTNLLIRDGAVPALSVDDILYEAGLVTLPARPAHQQVMTLLQTEENSPAPSVVPAALSPKPPAASLSEVQSRILETLSQTPKLSDAIGLQIGLSVSQLGVELTMLELGGLVQRLPGNRYILAP